MPTNEHKPKVLLLHWAGADWKVLQPLMDEGKLPNITKLVESGSSGKLATIGPLNAPLNTMSIATGVYGDQHGILDFCTTDENDIGARPVSSLDLKTSPLWQLINSQNKKAAAVGWPASQPATAFDGIVVSDAFQRAQGDSYASWPLKINSVSDKSIENELAELRLHPTEVQLEQTAFFLPEINKIDQETDERLPLLVANIGRISSIHNVGTWLVEQNNADFIALHFDFLEVISQHFLQYQAPQMAHVSDTDFTIYQQVVERACQFMDLLLGRYLELIDENTTVLLCSNHGFLTGDQRKNSQLSQNQLAETHYQSIGIFACMGKTISHDKLVFGASCFDIAPTVLHLLELPQADHLTGRIIPDLFLSPQLTSAQSYPSYDPKQRIAGDYQETFDMQIMLEWRTLHNIKVNANDKESFAEQVALHWQLTEAKFLMLRKNHQEASNSIEKLLASNPSDISARFTLVKCYFTLEHYTLIQPQIDILLELGVSSPLLDKFQGQLWLQQGNIESGLGTLMNAQQQSLQDFRLLWNIGKVFEAHNELKKAQQSFELSIIAFPHFSEGYNSLGKVFAKQGHHEKAEQAFRSALGILFVKPQAHLGLAYALAEQGKWQQALDAINNTLSFAPNWPAAEQIKVNIQKILVKKAKEMVTEFSEQ